MKSLTDTYTLHNGYKVPCIGYGTWQTPDGETAAAVVKEALRCGYRHIDTAGRYENEKGVGAGIHQAMEEYGIKREEIFVTSKVRNAARGYQTTKDAFEQTLEDMKLDYLDLYLIHWPAYSNCFENWEEVNLETWRAFTEMYKAGKIRAIGVSNFLPHHLEALMKTEVPPMVDQVECHPGYLQLDVQEFCRANNILVEAWSPLGSGRVLNDPRLMAMAESYGKNVAQLCIRFAMQNGIVPLPKSLNPSRILGNTEVFDFEISAEGMQAIKDMEEFGYSGFHPDHADW